MSRSIPVVLALAALSLVVAVPAQAIIVTVNFSVTGNNPLDLVNQGVTSNGTLTLDTNAFQLLDLDFTWDGTTWTEANASLIFYSAAGGQLTGWGIGGAPGGGGTINALNNADDIILDTSLLASFRYTRQGNTVNVFGVTGMTWSVDDGSGNGNEGSAPEPASWLLVMGSVVGAAAIRRRR